MILVTVGTQFGFDRLIQWMDVWAKDNPDEEVFAQIGQGEYRPKHMQWVAEISPLEFPNLVTRSRTLVSHAGMGTIISARLSAKTIIIVPRQASLGEHRNDHQLATARKFSGVPGCLVAETPEELYSQLAVSESAESCPPLNNASQLSQRIHAFLEKDAGIA